MPEILQSTFMVRALLGGGVVGLVCPVLGVFLVLRRLSLIAETLAHVALAGIAIGLLLQRAPLAVAVLTAVAAAVVIEQLRVRGRLPGEAALALVLYAALALTVVLVGARGGFNVDLFSYLFGSVVTITSADLAAIGALGVVMLGLVWLFWDDLVQSTFDPDLARVSGVNVGRASLLLAVLTGATVTLSMRLVGALLVGALIVIPVLLGLQMGRGFRATTAIAMGAGLLSVLLGLVFAYYQDVPAGGAIVLAALLLLLVGSAAVRVVARRAPA